MWRSDIERHSTSLRRSFEVSTVAALLETARRLRWTARRPRAKDMALGGSGAPQAMVQQIDVTSLGPRLRRYDAVVAVTSAGGGSKRSTVCRSWASSPL